MATFKEIVRFLDAVEFRILPKFNIDTFKSIATPDISNREVFRCSGSVITITNFLGGSDGQTIKIRGDGNTTISNNTNIATNTGANKLLANNKVYYYTYFSDTKKWYEKE
jgi:hypothetical protein